MNRRNFIKSLFLFPFLKLKGSALMNSPSHALQAVVTDFPIPNNTPKYIEWDKDLSANRGNAFRIDNVDASKIRLVNPDVSFALQGTSVWAANNAGFRVLGATFYRLDNTSMGTLEFHIVNATQDEKSGIPVADAVFPPDDTDLAYFRVFVKHTAGGELTLKSLRLTFSLI